MGPQEYFVVYELITDNLTVTYPNEGEKFTSEANANEQIHWDAIGTTAAFDLEYSTDNGGSWNTIATAGATARTFTWIVPTGVATAEALIRITSGAFQDQTDVPFIIAPRTVGIQFIEVCDTDATIQWNATVGADSYDVHVLGEKYMDLVGNTTDLQFTFPITDFNEPIYASVAPRHDTDGWVGRRQVATTHGGGLLNCILGVDDNELASNIVMYPNPASDVVNLAIANMTTDVNVTVTNILGQTMQQFTSSTSDSAINIANYNSGIYFVTVQAGNQTSTKKLLIK